MSNKIAQGDLYVFYGELLNEHQKSIYEDFVMNDLSLGEIAAERGISRQAVHDMIKRVTVTLEEYEDKLHLIQKFIRIRERVERIQGLTEQTPSELPTETVLDEINALSDAILEEL